jgi:4'-phosphopantetheinyl transferase
VTQAVVQVWWARPGDARAGLVELLDPVERARYDATTAGPETRNRFLVGCALSRLLLGDLLGVSPTDVPLRRVCPRCGGPHGKAAPAPGTGGDVRFSVSHSGDLVGVAVCRGADVGLDVEEAGTGTDLATAAPVALDARELAELNSRPPATREAAFLRYWTRKEAVLKALGVGLRVSPALLRVSAPEQPPQVLDWPERLGPRPALGLADLVVTGGHPACVAVTGASRVTATQHDASGMLASL